MVLIGFNYHKVKRNERELLFRFSRMQLGNVTRCLSNYLNPVGVSSLNNILGFSTSMGNSSRSYIRNFWNKPTAMPVPGHMHQNKRLDGNNKNLYVRIMILRLFYIINYYIEASNRSWCISLPYEKWIIIISIYF